jgi:hypothetical protein
MSRGPKGEECPAEVTGNAVHGMRIATGKSKNPPSTPARTMLERVA